MLAPLTVVLGLALVATQVAAQERPAFKDSRERISYALGVEAGNGFRTRAIDLDADAFAKGVKDGSSGATPLLTDEQVRSAIAELQAAVKRREIEGRTIRAEEDRKAAAAFLTANAKEEGVVTLPDGLQYRVLSPGQGSKPKGTDTVECRYRGTLVGGLEFDSSSRGGSSPTLKVSQAIAGLKEALQLMPVGSKWQVFVPPGLAVGPRAAMMVIPPNQALIYEIELLAIK